MLDTEWFPADALRLAALINGEASQIAGAPVTVISLAEVEDMPLGRYEQWHLFLRNRLQRRKVAAKAKR